MRTDRAATLQDIADRLGISRSTVSFAITGRGRVSEETRRRVHEVAAEIGYHPNTLARSLRGARTGMIALALPRDTSTMAYYMEATFGVVEEADRAGLIVSMLTAHASPSQLDRVHADGVILLDPLADDESARAILAGRLPVVTGEPVPPGLPEPRGDVMSDHASGVAELMDHLAERGSRHPALLSLDVPMQWAMTVRETFETWCTDRGMPPRVVALAHPPMSDDIHRCVTELLEGPEPVDAVVTTADGTVLSVATSAQRFGRRVGEDLLVAAAVDSAALELTQPSITAIDLHPREFGRRCMRALLTVLDADAVGAPQEFVREVIPLTLRKRQSTAGPLIAPRK
jgi:DNA-binding LacI/PurR family transcriptional regulator